MSTEQHSDIEGDVIDLTKPPEENLDGLTDRGDELHPELAKDSLSAVVANADDLEEVDDAKPDATKPSARIPKARFDEVNDQRKTALREAEEARQHAADLERELQALRQPSAATKAPTQAAPEFDVDAKEAEYTEALMEGETAKATAIRREINAQLRQQAVQEARESIERNMSQRQQESALQAESVASVEAYPYLGTEEGAEALELILASRDARIAKGVHPATALRQAVAAIAPRFAPPSGIAHETPKTDARTSNAMARGAADSNLQPPAVQAGIGSRATAGRVNVETLNDEQFDNLSQEEKKRLRGD